jgi:NADH-quinone oxidoreductase subunit L
MTVPLWILMAGAVVSGFLWVPHVFLPFEEWHAGVMHHAGHGAAGGVGLELSLMGLSVLVAGSGIGVAWLVYRRGRPRPETFSEALGGVPYRVVLAKYWVDEAYELVFVRGGLLLCRVAAWFDLNVIDGVVNLSAAVTRGVSHLSGLVDLHVVDGTVNLVADTTQFVGRRVRNVQTGAITAYLYVVLLGVVGGVVLFWVVV